MPDIILLNPGNNVGEALLYITAMNGATITASTADLIVMRNGSGQTIALSGTGFTTTVINGVTYINSGTVASIIINDGASDIYYFANLAMAGTTLRDAMQTDVERTDMRALENLFLRLTYTINGTSNGDVHVAGGLSVDGYALNLVRHNTYLMGNGNDTVTGLDGAMTRSLAVRVWICCTVMLAMTCFMARWTTTRCMAASAMTACTVGSAGSAAIRSTATTATIWLTLASPVQLTAMPATTPST